MEIMFSMKMKEDGKTLRMLLLCTECRQELEMARDCGGVRFRCPRHGELGTLTLQEFADGLRQAEEKAAQQYGLEKLARVRVKPAESTIQ